MVEFQESEFLATTAFSFSHISDHLANIPEMKNRPLLLNEIQINRDFFLRLQVRLTHSRGGCFRAESFFLLQKRLSAKSFLSSELKTSSFFSLKFERKQKM
jgi:hypothetical protein